ncbi:MAG TPA: alpha/beta hydrolase [Lapillicoccus sp.]|nr:alpha/beta hydrolase [Lapillicoccus sp.]
MPLGVSSSVMTTALGRIEFAVVGVGAPVLVLHGSPGGIDAAGLMARFLPKEEFAAVLVSRPGYMDTPLGPDPSVDGEADLLAALLDRLGLDRVGVHCWSGGGPAAYRLAVRHPGRVRSIVAFAAVSQAYPTPRLKLVDRLLFQTRAGNKLLSYLAAKQPQQFVTGVLAAEGSLSRPVLKERVAHVMANPEKLDFVVGLGLTAEETAERRIGYDNDLREFAAITSLELDRIAAPTLVIHGTADSDVPYEHGTFAASQIPGAELLSLESGTHLAFYTHPDSDEAQRRAIALLGDR